MLDYFLLSLWENKSNKKAFFDHEKKNQKPKAKTNKQTVKTMAAESLVRAQIPSPSQFPALRLIFFQVFYSP